MLVWPPTSRQAPPAERSTTLQAITGFFGSTMMVATLDTRPIGRVRTNLRFSPTFAPTFAPASRLIRLSLELQARVNSGLTTKTQPTPGQFAPPSRRHQRTRRRCPSTSAREDLRNSDGRSGATSRRRMRRAARQSSRSVLRSSPAWVARATRRYRDPRGISIAARRSIPTIHRFAPRRPWPTRSRRPRGCRPRQVQQHRGCCSRTMDRCWRARASASVNANAASIAQILPRQMKNTQAAERQAQRQRVKCNSSDAQKSTAICEEHGATAPTKCNDENQNSPRRRTCTTGIESVNDTE
jgi:hypothetical protein